MICSLCNQELNTTIRFCQLLTLVDQEDSLCSTCMENFQTISNCHCPTCYKEGEETTCSDCSFWQQEGIEVSHRALYRYNDAMKSYFSSYKFEGDYELRKVFSRTLKSVLKSYKGYTFVPVPLSPERLKKRGFNQVEGLLEAGKIPYQNLLEKTETKASSSKNRVERLESDFHFTIKKDCQLPEKILLFDDIYTTGATLNRIKKLLLEAGCQKIDTFSLAR
ncbi:Competence protein F-like protein, phosphoribosyltransferase domain [Streptococcus sp. DD10]|uniref:ComF family protein n=1 Tax=Streptococcus sp. DD10 TaxID=1777878 RepID=UPI00079A0E9C|nr:ComF family protein [Streptococcus sp. DD10]KXT74190.1 Competence protein F-like protein, phosphoribosyltransferase domain [Streptococcus sp. DD10]